MSQQTETTDLKKVLATGIRVGTDEDKINASIYHSASPEGLYMIDIDITLEKLRMLQNGNQFDMKNVIVCSGKEYATTPIEKFAELTGATHMLEDSCQEH